MADRAELVEAALEVYPEGVALLDAEERVVFWNRAAETLTGYPCAQVLGKAIPGPLEPLTDCPFFEAELKPCSGPQVRGTVVHAQHLRGHDVTAMARRVVLRDEVGRRIGTAAVFHPAEHNAELPHGETCEGSEVKASQTAVKERLGVAYGAFASEGAPLGVLWITVDQAHELRRTHGARACEAMLETVERTLTNALRSGEEVGRWGDDEFLVMAGEEDEELLLARAGTLAGMARTADFRWWGDRTSLTVSVGAAGADCDEPLAELLARAKGAMEESAHGGGNQVSLAAGRQKCSRL